MRDAGREAIRRALFICGGVRPLCGRLAVNAATVHRWLESEEIPREALLKVIAILVDDYDAWRAQDRRSEPRLRATGERRARARVA
ncbi:MAG: hypothetical protein ABR570_15440 [Burkholderiales bacterium]